MFLWVLKGNQKDSQPSNELREPIMYNVLPVIFLVGETMMYLCLASETPKELSFLYLVEPGGLVEPGFPPQKPVQISKSKPEIQTNLTGYLVYPQNQQVQTSST